MTIKSILSFSRYVFLRNDCQRTVLMCCTFLVKYSKDWHWFKLMEFLLVNSFLTLPQTWSPSKKFRMFQTPYWVTETGFYKTPWALLNTFQSENVINWPSKGKNPILNSLKVLSDHRFNNYIFAEINVTKINVKVWCSHTCTCVRRELIIAGLLLYLMLWTLYTEEILNRPQLSTHMGTRKTYQKEL